MSQVGAQICPECRSAVEPGRRFCSCGHQLPAVAPMTQRRLVVENRYVTMALSIVFVLLLCVGGVLVIFGVVRLITGQTDSDLVAAAAALVAGVVLALAAVPVGWAREVLIHLVGLRNDVRRQP